MNSISNDVKNEAVLCCIEHAFCNLDIDVFDEKIMREKAEKFIELLQNGGYYIDNIKGDLICTVCGEKNEVDVNEGFRVCVNEKCSMFMRV